jgi:ABC-type uncharacterized transport system substrate-binding protein
MTIMAMAACLAATPAAAHPHVFVDARAEVVFGATGEITAVRHIWQFDEAFSAFAIQGLDTDGDGKLSDAELQPLAKVNVESLQEFDFFTNLTVGETREVMVPPKEYWLELHGPRLTLFYTLPLKKAVKVAGKATLKVFDPEYFVAFTFLKDGPVKLNDAPAGCNAAYQAPKELDAQTMATMAAVPRDADMPPALIDAAAGLANLITVMCP